MIEEPAARTGRFGAVLVALVVLGSAAGVLGWHLMANRDAPRLDTAGFDLDKAPETARPVPTASASRRPEPAPRSSLGMFKADAGIRVAAGNSGARSAGPSPAAAAQQKKQESREDLAKNARKYENVMRSFAERMTAKYPVIKQYGKDWMSYPDLRKLNDDYMHDKDPVKFLLGVSRSGSFGKMVQKYAGEPAIREFVIEAVKQAPLDLKASALDVLANDRVIKDLVVNVAQGIGLPAGVTGTADGAGSMKTDQSKAMSDMVNDPEMKKTIQQNEQAAPVSSGR